MRTIKKLKYFLITGIMLILMISCSNLLETLENTKLPKDIFTIEFDLNGGKWSSDYNAPIYYTKGQVVELPKAENVSKTDYVFSGWYEAKDFSDLPVTQISEDATGKKLFYARWEVPPKPVEPEAKTITYTFKPNGGNWKGSTDDYVVSGKPGEYVQQPDYPLYQTVGMAFEKWDEEVPVLFGEEDKTYTAQWVPGTAYKVYHIKHNLDETTEVFHVQRVIGKTRGSTGGVARELYGFTPRGIGMLPIADDCSTVLEIHYDLKTVTYHFVADGGIIYGVPDDYVISGKYTSERTEEIPVPSKRGYTFIEWDTEIPDTFQYDDMNFNPVWEPIEYTITYGNCSNVTELNNPETFNIESETITLNNPTRANYTFSGWYKTSDFSGVAVTEIPTGTVGNQTLYAKWTPWQTIVAPKDYTPTVTASCRKYEDGSYSASIRAQLPSHCTTLSESNYKYTFIVDDIPLAIVSSSNTSYTYYISDYVRSLMPGTYTVVVTVEIYDVEGSYSSSYQLVVE